ncbi:hypothetical protein AZL_002510 [Azospirillum sp. B510]|uniref:ImuA family protein n=2 Tax=Alphaproteobacteria TaxID=28211 RepID=UPI0001C4C2B8|nr:hypothetical protein [Azospirillum sp. B510]BAI70889.1 hypothetical protein AZL_002510 [Azospirillum sp. B510]
MSVLPSPVQSAEAAPRDRAGMLAELRARIRRIEGAGGEEGRTLPFGLDSVDGHLSDGGLPLGCLHAVVTENPGAGTGFAAALLGRLATPKAPALWILCGRDLHAPGLAAYGLTADRLIVARPARPVDALWAMEEALRCPALSAVLGELEGLDLTASRRLQLAAESSGVTGFLLDSAAGKPGGQGSLRAEGLSAAVTRWRLDAAPSLGEENEAPRSSGSLPGLGLPRWSVRLERCRSGRPGGWTLAWDGGSWLDLGSGEEDGLAQAAQRDSGTWPTRRPVSDNRQEGLSDHRPGGGERTAVGR